MKKILLIVLFLVLTIMDVGLADDVYLDAVLPETADSMRWVWRYMTDSTIIDSTDHRTSRQRYDTTFTLPASDTGIYYTLEIYYPGADTLTTWTFQVGDCQITSWYIPAWLAEPADSAQWVLCYKDVHIDSSAVYTSFQRMDTTLTLPAADTSYWAVLKIWDDGNDTAYTWPWRQHPARTTTTASDSMAIARAVTRMLVDSAATRSDVFYGPSSGSGIYSHYIKVIDTSDNTTPDSALAYITVTAQNVSGSNVASGRTSATGYDIFSLDSGSYTFKIFLPPYQADEVTDTVTGNDDTTVIYAYDNGSSSTCRVWGYIKGYDRNGDYVGLYRQAVKFYPPKIDNTADSSVFPTEMLVAYTDADGYFYADLLRSSLLGDKEWKAVAGPRKATFTVPDSSAYHLAFKLE